MITQEALRIRIGLAADDDSRDAEIDLVFNMSLALCESYCDRKFLRVDGEEQEFTHFEGTTASMIRYPIIHVNSVGREESGAALNYYHVHKSAGLIMFDHYVWAHLMIINTDAGYSLDAAQDVDGVQLPADLEFCLWTLFDLLWPLHESGSGGATNVGAVESITLQDVGTIRMNTDSSIVIGGDGSGFGFLPFSVTSFLSLYRREKA